MRPAAEDVEVHPPPAVLGVPDRKGIEHDSAVQGVGVASGVLGVPDRKGIETDRSGWR